MSTHEWTQASVVEEAVLLAPMIADAVEEIDRDRRVPRHVIDALDRAGLFSMLLPEEFGGLEVELDVAAGATVAISRADASVGWQVVVGAGNKYFLGKLPEPSMRKAMSVGGSVFVRGAIAPKGVARQVDGGFVLSGRWPLASGSFDADWVPAGFLVMDGPEPKQTPDGRPEMRIAFLNPDDVRWYDTWDAVGLRGSQSQDFSVEELFVPEEWTGTFEGASSIDSPWFHLPPMPTAPLFSGVIVGALQGMIDDITVLAPAKKPSFGGGKSLADDPIFTTRFGELAANVEILTAANDHVARGLMAIAQSPPTHEPIDLQRVYATSARIQQAGTEIANDLLGLAGATAVYATNSLQRRWRDIRCAAMHASGGPPLYTALGGSLSRPSDAAPTPTKG